MKKFLSIIAAVTAVLLVGGLTLTMAQDVGPVVSLRGAQVDEHVNLPDVAKQQKKRFNRSFRMQPPLIPHGIEQYQMDIRVNQCLGCHDWSNAGDRDAPTLSMTHYLDREGRQLDEVAGTRWFCNQCHVPQTDASPLVENTFVPSSTR